MEATPRPDGLLSYLTALRARATQEIEARRPVELESQDTPEVVPPLIDVTITLSPTTSTHASEPSDDPSPHRIFPSLAEAFAHYVGRLVLLGRPGSGKTTTLWMFARERVDACLADPAQPLPIFLKIDTWNRKTPIVDWVLSQIPELPLQNVPLLYLCDGLDELGGERPVDPNQPEGERFDPRADFLRLVEKQFAESPFVISCRNAEYDQIRTKMHGCGAVTLLPLDEEKIEEFLASWDRPRLWQALRNDPNLMELARTPLLLSLLTSAVGADGIGTEQDLRHLSESTLFRFYFDRRFTHEERKFQAQNAGQSLPFNKADTQKSLGRLALYMWHWPTDPLTTLDRIEAQFHLGAQADTFLAFACRMHFLRVSPDGHIAFIHLKFRDFCVVPALRQTLEDRSREVRKATFDILVHLTEQGAPIITQALRNSDVAVRQEAACVFARFAADPDPPLQEMCRQALPALLDTLQDHDPAVRQHTARALACLGDLAVPALLHVLRTGSAAARRDVALGIADAGYRADHTRRETLAATAPVLLETLKTREANTRRKAAEALSRIVGRIAALSASAASQQSPLAGGNAGIDEEHASVAISSSEQTDFWTQESLQPLFPVLLTALRDRDYNVQHAVISALVLQGEFVVPALLPLLPESHPRVRQGAISVLLHLAESETPSHVQAAMSAIPTLLQALTNRSTAIRHSALSALSHLWFQPGIPLPEAFPQAVPALQTALKDSDLNVRLGAFSILASVEEYAVPTLLQGLSDTDVRVRREAASLLATSLKRVGLPPTAGFTEAIPALVQAVSDRDVQVRWHATSALNCLKSRQEPALQEALARSTRHLLRILKSGDLNVRLAAASILAHSVESPDPELRNALVQAIPLLFQALQRRTPAVRIEEFSVAETMGDEAFTALIDLAEQRDTVFQEAILQAAPALMQSLKRRSVEGQQYAAIVLAVLGSRIVPVLRQALQHQDAGVRRMVVLVVERLGYYPEEEREAFEQMLPVLTETLHDREASVRRATVAALTKAGEQAMPSLRQALGDRDRDVQQAAVSAFTDMYLPAIPMMVEALQDREALVRCNAAAVFHQLATLPWHSHWRTRAELNEALRQSTPALLRTLQDRDAGVRLAAISALVPQGEVVLPSLVEMLQDEDFAVRRRMVEVLGEHRSVIPALLRLLQSDQPATRWAALATLEKHGYVPRLAFRPCLHVTLRHGLGQGGSAASRMLLKLPMRVPFLQRISIHLFELEE